MAFEKAPTAILPGYASDGTHITIPIAALDGLTAPACDAATGDWRAIVLALCSTAFRYYKDLPVADRPQAFKAYPPTRVPVNSGALEGTFKETFEFDFYNSWETPDIAEEPT
jgi:hypothetical protein